MTQTKLSAWLGTALLLAGADRAALAEDRDARLDEAVIAGTYQASTTSHANNEATGQLYLLGSLDMGPGAWHLELRGGTTPRHNGLAGAYESNALVGETVNSHGDGRIAATQLYYELPVGPGEFRAGLLDPTALLDANETANDEYTQFLADAFVNNPAIGFPSFVLGGAYRADLNIPLIFSSIFRSHFVVASILQHSPDDPRQVATEGSHGLIMMFALGAFSIVVRA